MLAGLDDVVDDFVGIVGLFRHELRVGDQQLDASLLYVLQDVLRADLAHRLRPAQTPPRAVARRAKRPRHTLLRPDEDVQALPYAPSDDRGLIDRAVGCRRLRVSAWNARVEPFPGTTHGTGFPSMTCSSTLAMLWQT